MNIFVALLCACIVIGHLLEENRWMNESITALIIGLFTGVVILLINDGRSSHLLVFSEDLFFIYLLPPIIFNAGFQVKKKQFFHNFITIMLFGAVGVISFFKEMDIGSLDIGDFLAIGAMFAATDSVCTLQVLSQDETPLLYSLVFGESVVNDATSVVLFKAIQSFDLTNTNPKIALELFGKFLYLFLASTVLGMVVGLFSAYIIKKLYFGRHSTDREFALMMLMAYLSYIMAELFYLSGILTVFFCGIVMSHYTWHNVTESSRVFGLMTKPLIRFVLPHSKATTSMLSDQSTPKPMEAPFLWTPLMIVFSEFIDRTALLTTPANTVHYYWRKFYNAVMRPMFGGRGFVPFVPGSPTERSEHNIPQWQ
ncbi:hypothetical protein V6N13_064049 [Hibiscus sabdariffa]